jgi:hypothetical protein
MRILSIFLALAGCETKSGCTPGASVACACVDGTIGAQSCRPDGTFDVCVCAMPINNQPIGDIRDMGGNNQQGIIHDLATPGSSGGAKRVFVTSTSYVGSAVLDACSTAAAAANLGGTWKPWLSTAGQDALDSISATGPWKRLDGVLVFNNHANLATQPLALIDIDENGSLAGGAAWTGTNTGGRKSIYNCQSWTDGSSSAIGDYGRVDQGTDQWTAAGATDCSQPLRVYCLEN